MAYECMDFDGYADVGLVELGFQFCVVSAFGFPAGICPTVCVGAEGRLLEDQSSGAAHHQFRKPVGHPLRLLGCRR
jgi:hypothetical protein